MQQSLLRQHPSHHTPSHPCDIQGYPSFPENYSSEKLAGQEVTFRFKVNYICKKITADEVTTDFLKKNFSVDSKQAFYDYAKKKLQQENKTNKAQEAWSLVANAVEAPCSLILSGCWFPVCPWPLSQLSSGYCFALLSWAYLLGYSSSSWPNWL